MTIENESYAQRFQQMHDKIMHNVDAQLGGCAVIIPPSKSGIEQPIELLMLDAAGDPAQFLSTIMSRIQIMLREIEDRARMQQGFGPR